MKVVFVANTVNFHMTGLFDEFTSQHSDVDFVYLSTSKMDDERTHMGYKDLQREYAKYSLDMTEDELNTLFLSTDIVIYGLSDDPRVHSYIPYAKNLCVISEHIKRHNPIRNIISIINHFYRKRKFMLKMHNKYLLAMSSYAGDEYKHFGFKDRCYRFGYFPALEEPDNSNRDQFSLLYCGRLLKLKHVEHAIYALNYLKKHDSRYHLDIIGEGITQPYLEQLTSKLNLDDSVKFYKFQNHNEVVRQYSNHELAFFPSDKKEGWGVVLNEMLSQKCIVFASKKAGSTRFLINENNGFSYKNLKNLFEKLDNFLSMTDDEKNTMKNNAFLTIDKQWNNKEAAFRLYELFDSILKNKTFDKYQSGPVSLIK